MACLLIMVWGEGRSWGRLGPQAPCSSSDPCPSSDAKMSPLRSRATTRAGADVSARPCHSGHPGAWSLGEEDLTAWMSCLMSLVSGCREQLVGTHRPPGCPWGPKP